MANPPKTKRGQDTRDRILAVTQGLLTDCGPSGVTLDQVSQKAGVAKTSILWHFGSKEELFLEVMEQVMSGFETAFYFQLAQGEKVPGLGEKIRRFFPGYAELLETYADASALFYRSVFDPQTPEPIKERLRELYAAWREVITLETGGNQAMAAMVLALLDGLFLQWYLDRDAVDLKAVFQEGAGMVEHWVLARDPEKEEP